MTTPLENKSTTAEIRARFDQDVERFSRLETGQQATIDAPLVLDLVAQTAAMHLHPGDTVLDLGCGAGNFALRVLHEVGYHDLGGFESSVVEAAKPASAPCPQLGGRLHQKIKKA